MRTFPAPSVRLVGPLHFVLRYPRVGHGELTFQMGAVNDGSDSMLPFRHPTSRSPRQAGAGEVDSKVGDRHRRDSPAGATVSRRWRSRRTSYATSGPSAVQRVPEHRRSSPVGETTRTRSQVPAKAVTRTFAVSVTKLFRGFGGRPRVLSAGSNLFRGITVSWNRSGRSAQREASLASKPARFVSPQISFLSPTTGFFPCWLPIRLISTASHRQLRPALLCV
jgi:hypothetical protein